MGRISRFLKRRSQALKVGTGVPCAWYNSAKIVAALPSPCAGCSQWPAQGSPQLSILRTQGFEKCCKVFCVVSEPAVAFRGTLVEEASRLSRVPCRASTGVAGGAGGGLQGWGMDTGGTSGPVCSYRVGESSSCRASHTSRAGVGASLAGESGLGELHRLHHPYVLCTQTPTRWE